MSVDLRVFVLLTLWCHGPLSPFLPAAYEPVLLLYGSLYRPLLVAALGAASSLAPEYLNLRLYGGVLRGPGLRRLRESRLARGAADLFGRCPFVAVCLVACTPLPDWTARTLAAVTRYPARRYLLAFLLGRLPKFWVLAALGPAWRFGSASLVALALTPLAIWVGTLAWRRVTAARAAGRAAVREAPLGLP